MNLVNTTQKSPEAKARKLLRSGKWKNAVTAIEELASANEQDYAKWNLLGDTQFRAGDKVGANLNWQRALDGYVQDALHENALGVARKIARLVPEETGVHLTMSDSYLGLEYYADAVAAFRSFIKLNRSSLPAERKSWFKRVMSLEVRHPHLTEEVVQLLTESGLEDIELERDVKAWSERMSITAETPQVEPEISLEPSPMLESPVYEEDQSGLSSLDASGTENEYSLHAPTFEAAHDLTGRTSQLAEQAAYEIPMDQAAEDLPDGQGKDHYDLGVVYAEMKLWDAAITEFQTARRDQSVRGKATIELAQCYRNSNDPHRALRLLEEESALGTYEVGVQDDLLYQMGVLHQMLGNVDEAIQNLEKVGHESGYYIDAANRISDLRGQ
ncbi:MAG: tetratricopeptide repeat protein [Calditrichaeota bacterium]|nr:tetratricopeptide repeat protein [Calditrichota bacterium]MCB9391041.1 tetratricopeptide repeat protein [Calditrichota bacterium]